MIQPSRVLLLAKMSVASSRLVQSQRRLLTCVAQYKQTKQLSASRYGRSLHATPALSHLVHKDFEKAQPTPEESSESEDTIPEWQNPLHHNNSDLKKMFPEDFSEGQELPVLPLPPLSTDDPDKVVAPPHIHDLAHEIVNLTLLELKELTNQIADHFGFDDDVMAASYGGGAAAAATPAASEQVEEEKTLFDVKLVGFDAKAKIKVIKEVRAIGGLGLKEAKELVESAPKVIQKDLSQEKADELKAQLEAIGAQVEIV
jgi:large subunit ribosomal protein L7/L12